MVGRTRTLPGRILAKFHDKLHEWDNKVFFVESHEGWGFQYPGKDNPIIPLEHDEDEFHALGVDSEAYLSTGNLQC